MSKFLSILEKYSPENTGDPKWELIDFLKSKGVNVRLDRFSKNGIIIDTGGTYEVRVEVSSFNNEEEGQAMSINSDQELGNIVSSGDPIAPKAAQILKKKKSLYPKIVSSAENQLKETEKMLNKPKSPIIR